MDVILVPGLWLDLESWRDVLPPLVHEGHVVHPLTMPGVGLPASASSDLGMDDWVAATVEAIDRLEGPVALVGHSGGGNVAWGAADARVERVARVVFVDAVPPAPGGSIGEFSVVDGVVPFPGWDTFEAADTDDLDAETRRVWADRAASIPARVPGDGLTLTDARRWDLPVTVLTSTFPAAAIAEVIADPPPWAAELAALRALEVVEIDGGHWPQFSRPSELGAVIATVLNAETTVLDAER